MTSIEVEELASANLNNRRMLEFLQFLKALLLLSYIAPSVYHVELEISFAVPKVSHAAFREHWERLFQKKVLLDEKAMTSSFMSMYPRIDGNANGQRVPDVPALILLSDFFLGVGFVLL